jgi:hypothetical protein
MSEILDIRNTTFRRLNLFPSTGELTSITGPNRVGVSLLSPEDGNRLLTIPDGGQSPEDQ